MATDRERDSFREIEETADSNTAQREPGLEETLQWTHKAGKWLGQQSFGNGRYEARRWLGEGGQKQVVLAHDTQLHREVVIAILKQATLNTRDLERIRVEARTMARVGDHPHVVSVYDIGEEQGQPYIVAQYLQGGSVADLLKEHGSQPLPITEAVRIAEQTCRALTHAHQLGIVHRDVKPSNVWLTHDGDIKLGDFGLAAALDRDRFAGSEEAVGTAAYMPPEQAVGADVSPQSDLYSLGVMLYEMVTGRRPFSGDTVLAVISQHLNASPTPPAWHSEHVPETLDSLILQLLAKVPEDRPRSAAAVLEVLLGVLSQDLQARHGQRRSVDRLASGVFVGRQEEMDQLCRGLEEAIAARGSVFTIVGDPGSGKTRLAEEVRTFARLRNVEVLVGRCFEGEGAPAFWPWIQIFRSLAEERDQADLLDLMGAGAADIAQIDADVARRLPKLSAPPSLEPEQARYRLFDSISTFVCQAGRARPLFLILDDLQWADEPSLRLLQFLAGEIRDVPLLVLGSCRPVSPEHPLSQALGELHGERGGRRIELQNLARDSVAQIIRSTTGVQPAGEMVDAIWEKTEGNAFFVSEIIRLLVEEGRLGEQAEELVFQIPEGVRGVIGRRLDHLSEECLSTLTTASVVGREFSSGLLGRLSKLTDDRLQEALQEATTARILTPAGVEAVYSFTHDLIRETLYEELSVARRLRLHARIGRALEELHSHDLVPHLGELAQHFFRAARVGEVDKAIDYARWASQRSLELVAYEEAVRFSRMAVKALDLQTPQNEEQRCELELVLGEAQRKAGQVLSAIETYQRNARLAKRLQLEEPLARSALGFEEATFRHGRPGGETIRMAEDALREMDSRDSTLRARLLGGLARGLRYDGRPDEANLKAREAVEMARRVGDPSALAHTLYSLLDTLDGPEHTSERIVLATEMLRAAKEAKDVERTLEAHMWRMVNLLELGEAEEAKSDVEQHGELANEARQPFYLYVETGFLAMWALLEGRFKEAQELSQKALKLGQRIGAEHAEGAFGLQMFTISRQKGQLQMIAPLVKKFVQDNAAASTWRPGLALIYAELGLREEAAKEFDTLAQSDFSNIVEDSLRGTSLTFIADVCAFLGDSLRAETIYQLLLPSAKLNLVAGGTIICSGSASRSLGRLAATMSRWDEAEQHFQEAISMNSKIGARPWLAYSQHQYSEMLLTRGRGSDRERARLLRDEALGLSRELGMETLADLLSKGQT